MTTTTVTVAYVNAPRPNKKKGTIKVDDGSYYLAFPNILSQFREGGKYEITYETSEYQGRMYRTVQTVKALDGSSNVSAPQVFQAPEPAMSGARYGNADDKTAERIFVCGALNAAITSKAIELNIASLTQLVTILRTVWKATFGDNSAVAAAGRQGAVMAQPQAAPAPGAMTPRVVVNNDDMNDEIPF